MKMSKGKKDNLTKLKENEIESISGGVTDKEFKKIKLPSWEESEGTCKRCGKTYTYCTQGVETGIDKIFSRRNYCWECRSTLKKDPKKIFDKNSSSK